METIDELNELHIQVGHVEASRDEQVVEFLVLLAEVAANVRSTVPGIVVLICCSVSLIVGIKCFDSAVGLIEPVVCEGLKT